MPPAIETFAKWCLKNPVEVEIARAEVPSTVTHAFYPVAMDQRDELLLALLERTDYHSVMIFTRTRKEAESSSWFEVSGTGAKTQVRALLTEADPAETMRRQLRMLGESNIKAYQIEKNKRFAFPFSSFILTLIGVSVSSRKVKGGIGMQLGIGLMVAFSYLLFMQFSSQFAINGSLHPVVAVWMPNLVYSFVAIFLYRLAPK